MRPSRYALRLRELIERDGHTGGGRRMTVPAGRVLVRGTLFNLLGNGVPLIVALICLPAVVSGFGTDRFGVLALAWAILGTMAAFDLGTGRATALFLSRALSHGSGDEAARIFTASLLVQAVLGIVSGTLVAACAPMLVDGAFGLGAGLRQESIATLRWIGVSIPLVLLSNGLQSALHAAQRFDRANIVAVLSTSTNYVVPAFTAPAGWTLPATVAVIVLSKAVAGVVLWRMVGRDCPGLAHRRFAADRDMLRSLVRVGWWFAVSSVIAPILRQAERLLIPALVSVTALTFYTIPFEAVSRAAIVPVSMALALFPAFSVTDKDAGSVVAGLVVKPFRYLMLVMTPLLTVPVVFANELLTAWMGQPFASQAATPLRLLAIAFYVSAFSTILRTAVQGLGRPDLKARMDVGNALFFLPLLIGLTLMRGLEGAATARLLMTVVELAGLLVLLSSIARTFRPLSLLQAIRSDLLLALTFVLAVCTVGIASSRAPVSYAAVAMLACAYLAAFWVWLADSTDRRAAVHAVSLLSDLRPLWLAAWGSRLAARVGRRIGGARS